MSEVTRADRAKAVADYMKKKRGKKKKDEKETSLFESLFGSRLKKLSAGSKKPKKD